MTTSQNASGPDATGGAGAEQKIVGPQSAAERNKRRRSRSIAIAVILAALVILFYVITILKLSGGGPVPEL